MVWEFGRNEAPVARAREREREEFEEEVRELVAEAALAARAMAGRRVLPVMRGA